VPAAGSGDFSAAGGGPHQLGDGTGVNGARTEGGTIVLENLIIPTGVTVQIDRSDIDPGVTGNQGFLPAIIVVAGSVDIQGTGRLEVNGGAGQSGINGTEFGGFGGDGGPGGGGGAGGGGDDGGGGAADGGDGGDGFTGGGGGSTDDGSGRIGGTGGDGTGALGSGPGGPSSRDGGSGSSTVQVEAVEAQEEMKMEPQEEGVLVEEDVLMIIQLEEQDLQKQVKL